MTISWELGLLLVIFLNGLKKQSKRRDGKTVGKKLVERMKWVSVQFKNKYYFVY